MPKYHLKKTVAALATKQQATQMAWKKQRDHHLVIIRSQYSEELVPHVRAHEFTHIALEAEARSKGRNKWFGTTAVSRETALRSMAGDIRKMERGGGQLQ